MDNGDYHIQKQTFICKFYIRKYCYVSRLEIKPKEEVDVLYLLYFHAIVFNAIVFNLKRRISGHAIDFVFVQKS